jgi:perosamine synthetase
MNEEAPASTISRFEPGAPAAAGRIPLCVPHMGGNEGDYVQACIETNFVSSVGSFVTRFEQSLADYVGSLHAVAVVNGTAALHVALLTCGVQPDDEVLVSTLSFIAPANAIRYAGAWPVFVDAEPSYWQMDVARVADFLAADCGRVGGELRNRRTGRRVSAIMPVHILGHPVDMDPLLELAREYGLAVVEDATESVGARYRGRMLGTLGDAGCFSFNGNKLITTGGGGMVVTNREEIGARTRYLTTQAKDDPIEFVHGAVGFNYRLTNVQAALGCAQMERIDEHIAAKRRIAARYERELAGLPGVTPMPHAPWAESVDWLYTVGIRGQDGVGSRPILHALDQAGIQTRPLWQPLHLSPAHRPNDARCPVAEEIQREALSLPCSVGLTDDEQTRVIRAVTDAISARA